MRRAIEDLRREHEAVLTSLRILKAMLNQLNHKKSDLGADFQHFIGFLKEFADQCHHGKEEEFLFPAMIEAGMHEKGGPIEIMLAEHGQGRRLVKEMEAALTDGLDGARMTTLARQYSTLLDNHIQKEDNVLFVMAEKILNPKRLAKLHDSFELHEKNVIGHGRHGELHAILEDLKARYL